MKQKLEFAPVVMMRVGNDLKYIHPSFVNHLNSSGCRIKWQGYGVNFVMCLPVLCQVRVRKRALPLYMYAYTCGPYTHVCMRSCVR
jgi:hypothetical protein